MDCSRWHYLWTIQILEHEPGSKRRLHQSTKTTCCKWLSKSESPNTSLIVSEGRESYDPGKNYIILHQKMLPTDLYDHYLLFNASNLFIKIVNSSSWDFFSGALVVGFEIAVVFFAVVTGVASWSSALAASSVGGISGRTGVSEVKGSSRALRVTGDTDSCDITKSVMWRVLKYDIG